MRPVKTIKRPGVTDAHRSWETLSLAGSLAVESEDAAAVTGVVQELGLSNLSNQNYPRWLKTMMGMAPMS
jgi:hypothetical protein